MVPTVDKAVARYVARIALLTGAYVAVARLGLMLDAVSGFAALVWPATGLALAALLLGGYRYWPGVALGALIANIWTGAPPLVALFISVGNTLEAVVSAYAMRRWGRFVPPLDTVREVLTLVGV